MSNFSGFPKFKQSVNAIGSAPVQAKFLHASATDIIPPMNGSRKHNRLLPSVVNAMPLEVFLTLNTAASPPGPSTVFVCT